MKKVLFVCAMILYVVTCFVLVGARMMVNPNDFWISLIRPVDDISIVKMIKARQNEATVTKNVGEYLSMRFEGLNSNSLLYMNWSENPAITISMIDGSDTIFKMPHKGGKYVYTVYSSKEDLEFTLSYNSETNEYSDTYQYYRDMRKSIDDMILSVEKMSDLYIDKIQFCGDNPKRVSYSGLAFTDYYAREELYALLSRIDERYDDGIDNHMYLTLVIDRSAGELCDENSSSLDKIKNEYFALIKKYWNNYDEMFELNIITREGHRIYFEYQGNTPLWIDDEYNGELDPIDTYNSK